MARSIMKWFQVLAVIISTQWVSIAWAEETATGSESAVSQEADGSDTSSTSYEVGEDVAPIERPGFLPVIADAVLVRPVTLVATAVGAVIWVVTLPLTAVTGTVGEAGQTLVVDPAATTFYRCLGCTEVGWRKLPKKVD